MTKIIQNYDYLKGNKYAVGNKPNKTCFKKGDIPWNKNKKGFHSSPITEFKKGQKGIRWKPLKSITIRIDKNGKNRRWIKIEEPNIWIVYAKFVWIKHNGEIPKGCLIHHKDKNTLNDNIKNLASFTRKDHINVHRKDLKKRISKVIYQPTLL